MEGCGASQWFGNKENSMTGNLGGARKVRQRGKCTIKKSGARGFRVKVRDCPASKGETASAKQSLRLKRILEF